MVAEAVAAFGGLDLVLNAAGVMDGTDPSKPLDYDNDMPLMPASIHKATDAYWHTMIATNATGMFKSMRAELRQMVEQGRGGAIVCIGSIAGIIGLAGNPAYVASKHSVTGLAATPPSTTPRTASGSTRSTWPRPTRRWWFGPTSS